MWTEGVVQPVSSVCICGFALITLPFGSLEFVTVDTGSTEFVTVQFWTTEFVMVDIGGAGPARLYMYQVGHYAIPSNRNVFYRFHKRSGFYITLELAV